MVKTSRCLIARYRLERKIAAGGMGTVYAAVDDRLGRRVAVKILARRLAEDPAFIERFKREARAAAALSHPNIARVFDYGEDGPDHFSVMELVEGEDLARVLRDHGPLTPDRVTRIAAQMCAALDHAHAAGLVHRDVKPANVIVGPDDRVKVTDFGIARAVGEAKLTATGTVMGTGSPRKQGLRGRDTRGRPGQPRAGPRRRTDRDDRSGPWGTCRRRRLHCPLRQHRRRRR